MVNIKSTHNIDILLTDNEEKINAGSLSEQGAYLIANEYRNKKIKDNLFFVFDICGRGDTLLLSNSPEYFLKQNGKENSAIYKNEKILKDYALDIGLSNDFKLLDTTSAWMMVRENLDKFDLDYYSPLGSPTRFIHGLLSHFSRLKDEVVYPDQYLK